MSISANAARWLAIFLIPAVPAGALAATSLSNVTVMVPASAVVPEKMAAQMLVEEVARRTGTHWQLVKSPLQDAVGVSIVLTTSKELETLTLPTALMNGIDRRHAPMAAESYRISAITFGKQSWIVVEGHDPRGVLFGAGFLLRHMDMTTGSTIAPGGLDSLNTVQAPAYPVRGHQLGYRPKNNTFDGWSAAQFEQYIRDLAVFGTNTIELIPPRSDDAASSPLFTLPPLTMMQSISAILDRYGLDCSIWYPAMDKDYSDPATVDLAVAEWGAVFQSLPKVDAVFVPGGDPGHTQPRYLFRLLEREATELHRTHPQAQMWVSPQSFDAPWLAEFYALLERHPKWLTGVVYGPEMRESPEAFRSHIPREYPVRFYPDITHALASQYPVPLWDPAFALTEGREPINPEPALQDLLFHRYAPESNGFVAYSEGSNDDVNKILWSAWGWDPAQTADKTLEEYARYFLLPASATLASEAIRGLERNWQGPVASNESISATLGKLQQIADSTGLGAAANWRMQQLLYRAYYDAYIRSRVQNESAQEDRVLSTLQDFPHVGAQRALQQAKAIAAAMPDCKHSPLCTQADALAADLFRTVRMQLSVTRFSALATDRGANLDRIDAPINDLPWLRDRIDLAIHASSESEKIRGIITMLTALEPAHNLIVDDLGPFGKHLHLVQGSAFKRDPSGLTGVYFSVNPAPPQPAELLFERTFAGTLYDMPLTLHYSGLKGGSRYGVHIIYPSLIDGVHITANGVVVQQECADTTTCRESDLTLPVVSTPSGELTLEWAGPVGLGGNGRRVKVSRVSLAEVP